MKEICFIGQKYSAIDILWYYFYYAYLVYNEGDLKSPVNKCKDKPYHKMG